MQSYINLNWSQPPKWRKWVFVQYTIYIKKISWDTRLPWPSYLGLNILTTFVPWLISYFRCTDHNFLLRMMGSVLKCVENQNPCLVGFRFLKFCLNFFICGNILRWDVLSVTLSACNCKVLENPRTFSFGDIRISQDWFSPAYTRFSIPTTFIPKKKSRHQITAAFVFGTEYLNNFFYMINFVFPMHRPQLST